MIIFIQNFSIPFILLKENHKTCNLYYSHLIKIFFFFILIFSSHLNSQTQKNEKVKVIAGSQYEAGWLHRFFAGAHWRDLWITPFEAEVLNIDTFAGGLTPVKTGGGMQTKSLHFIGKDGRRYKFRSIDKDPSRSLPPELRESLIADAMQDQVPVQNPVSAIIVAPLMNAVGILNAEPMLFVMPDSEKLNEFRNDFADILGTIEENPDDYEDDELNFAGSDKIVSTFKLFERLEKDNDERVDEIEFLKSRLFDIFIGDRDRHAGQWKWAGYKEGKKRRWIPIPKDRDFAFPLYNGLIPKIMTLAVTSMVHFDYDLPSMFDMTWEGRHLDRRFLGKIEKAKWDSIGNFMKETLTEKFIEESVLRMPPELFELRGQEIIGKLKSRRDQLLDASEEFYKLIMRYVDLYGSNQKEFVEITRLDNNFTSVKMYKRESKSEDERGELLFEKVYDHNYTEEIRIHLQGGDDKALIKGNVNRGLLVVVDGGDGADELIDSSVVKDKVLGFLPFNTVVTKTKLYDYGKKSLFSPGPSTYINTRPWKTFSTPEEKYEPVIEDRFRDFTLLFPFAINSDDGLVYGLGGRWNFYDFRVEPYSYSLSLSGAHSIKSQSYEFIGLGDFNKLIEGANFNIESIVMRHDKSRFFGIGNETVFDINLLEDEYYHVGQRKLATKGFFTFPIKNKTHFGFGLSIENIEIRKTTNSLVDDTELKGKGNNTFISFLSEIKFDSRDNIYSAYKGLYLKLAVEQYPILFNNFSDPFGIVSFEGRTYLSGNTITHHTLAIKTIGKYIWGKYPFYKSAYVGGSNSLRGYSIHRFRGDASFAIQSELRFLIGTVTLFIPGQFGFNLFADAGRVFMKNVSSHSWHLSQGGGIWFSILERAIVFSFNTAKSREELTFYLNIGQSF
jgi:hypothetical protein